MKNELQQKRYEKMYKDYYSMYNKGGRQIHENIPQRTVQGTVSWVEPGVDNPLYTLRVLVGGERI
jgi:hypothetical protein